MKNERLETNLKVIKGGKSLKLSTKVIKLSGGELNIDDIQKVCSLLGYHYRISATPYAISPSPLILINSKTKIENCAVKLKKGSLSFNVIPHESGELLTLDFQDFSHRAFLADLFKRAFLISITSKRESYWTFDSPRIFYAREPFKEGERSSKFDSSDISVFRRYEISEVILDDGIAIGVDVGTAFFTNIPVDHYFKNGNEKRFKKLTKRQDEQKGTLLYKNPRGGYSKCYFVKYEKNVTCGSTHSFQYDGNQYQNLFDYYQKINPKYPVHKNDNVAYVNFTGGLDETLPVAANKLFIRVMNDMLPYELSRLDKISPKERVDLLDQFWVNFGRSPFGDDFPGLEFGGKNYLPHVKAGVLSIPPLIFNGKNILTPPKDETLKSYSENFKSRKSELLKHGCFFNPLTITREIHFVYPQTLKASIVEDFANDVCDLASSLTKVSIEPTIEAYSDYKEMLRTLNQETGSMVVFIFDKIEPATYFTISHELKDWNIKRVTSQQIVKKHEIREARRGNWNSFVELNTFDILQQLGCVPWTCPPGNYDIQLAIDVSDKFTHFCFSFYMYNAEMQKPIIKTDTFTKSNRKEKINQAILENKLNGLFEGWSNDLITHRPLKMLVIRDGKVCEGEYEAIESAIKNQIGKGNIASEFQFDVIEYHKTTLKSLRLWTRNLNDGSISNVLEGTYFILNDLCAVLSPTGCATLNQGTAHPILIKKINGDGDIKAILQDVFSLSQLNFSSPTVAQGNCLPIKRADEQLKDRKMQEVERIK